MQIIRKTCKIASYVRGQKTQGKSIVENNLNTGLPRSGKKFWKMKNFPGQGKVRELHFQLGKFKKKNEKQIY